MKAVCFDATVPGFLKAAATRRWWPSAMLVTHTFLLDDYRKALSAARNHGQSGAIKVRITPKSRQAGDSP